MVNIEQYLKKKPGALQIRRFCREVFQTETERRGLKNANLKFLPLAPHINGMLLVRRKKGTFHYNVVLNILSCRVKRNVSVEMTLYYLYNTIVHELKHIELLDVRKIHTYAELMAHYEEAYDLICHRPIDIVQLFPLHGNRKQVRQRQYQTSFSEVLSNLEGYTAALKVMRGHLEPNSIATLETIIDSLSFLCEHVAITYSNSNHPYNAFVYAVQGLQRCLKHKKLRGRVTPLAQLLFTEGGEMWSMSHLAATPTSEQTVIDELLVNSFITLDVDLTGTFEKNPELKERMARLANEYCARTINFIQQQKKGEVFLDEAVLQDNAAMLIMNANRLNQLMAKYGMEHTGGSVIPLYIADIQYEQQ